MKIENHAKFYEWQIEVIGEEWYQYFNTSVNILQQEKKLFVGKIWGIDRVKGNLILRFKTKQTPRMNNYYNLCIVGGGVSGNPATWNFSYKEFRFSKNLSGKNTQIKTLFPLKSNDLDWNFIGVNGADYDFVNNIDKLILERGIKPLIILALPDPPTDYLNNLRSFVLANPHNRILNLPLNRSDENWNPHLIDNEKDILPTVVDKLEENNQLLIQGPPGTGKSYLVAQICDHYLAKNYSIVVTALANKALVEVAEKDGLKKWLNSSMVLKTNLSHDERKTIPKLEPAIEITPNKRELLLSTYYKLSDKIDFFLKEDIRYDLLIIEEASQTFLATIAAFSSMAHKLLIIGDHKQLPPIVKRKEDAQKLIDKDIWGAILGLQTFAFNHDNLSNRLTKTRRLTSPVAKLTGTFYNNSLKSISPLEGKVKFDTVYPNIFAKNGGISIIKLPVVFRNFTVENIYSFLIEIGIDLLNKNKELEIAFLSPNIHVENSFYDAYRKRSSNYSRITISTIHKIQGLTTDIVFLFLALDNPNFDLNENIFNVATSRAKKGTIIITKESIDFLPTISVNVNSFIKDVQNVSNDFFKYFNH